MTNEKLISLALLARENAYAPYSGFKVGAALLTDSGKVYTGCNIENASYGETVCAERTAFFKAISEGERFFSKIAIVGGKEGEKTVPCYPCGACRQVMREFCKDDFNVVIEGNNDTKELMLIELLPFSFSSSGL